MMKTQMSFLTQIKNSASELTPAFQDSPLCCVNSC